MTQKVRHESLPPVPLKTSAHITDTISQAKHTQTSRFDCYLPANTATKRLIDTHVFIDGGKGPTQPIPVPALRNSLYLAKSQFTMNVDHLGKKSLVTNAQANSRDLPEWCLGPMKYYKPENFDISQAKKGPQDTDKKDIFGKKLLPGNVNHKEQFASEVPSKYLFTKHNKHSTILIDRFYDKANKKSAGDFKPATSDGEPKLPKSLTNTALMTPSMLLDKKPEKKNKPKVPLPKELAESLEKATRVNIDMGWPQTDGDKALQRQMALTAKIGVD